jgi:hypothetical protein
MKKKILNQDVMIKRIVEGDKHYFFGYHNNSQISKNGRFALALEVDFIDRYPTGKDVANILLIDLEKNSKKKIAETRAWNWQQGCMLQWLGPDFNSKIIFNDLEGNKIISKILDINTKKERIINYPVYDVHSSGKSALGFSYSKLRKVRIGYGYAEESLNEFKENFEEGVYLVDLKRNKSKEIINLESLKKYKPLFSMNKGRHWIDQPVFNPSGKRICFLHRWELEGGLFHTRFFTIDLKGKDLFLFPDSGFYSHFTWKNDEEILVWCSISEKFSNVRKSNKKSNFLIEKILPIYRKITPRYIRKKILPVGYYLIKDQSKERKKINIYYEDGHPSFSKDKKYLITDTYPDSKNYRKLILFDWKKQKRKILGKFYSIPNKKYLKKQIKDFGNSGIRCDLHPRWNFQGNKITFDSVHEGKRNCYIFNLNSNY